MMPTIILRSLRVRATVRTKTVRTVMNMASISSTSKTLSLFCFSAVQIKKMIMYTISIPVPAPLMVKTSKLSGCTMGSPYKTHTMQFTRVARYGTGEYCSTAFFFHIWIKVGLDKMSFNKNKNKTILVWLLVMILMN